jgi:ABC-type lipoprotein release transport system permease subunit
MFVMPLDDFPALPIPFITSKVLRPIRNVSNWLMMPAKSISGSIRIDSPLTYVLVAMIQVTIAIAAAAIPGRRASRADPLAALRTD